MSATHTCGACLKAIAPGHLTRSMVTRGYYADVVAGDAAAPLRLEVVQVHVDCEDVEGERVYDCRRRA